MTKIRKLYYFDKKKTKEMISFLNNGDTYINHIMFSPLAPFHHLLPLKIKFIPESYILKDKNDVKGLITIAPSRCPQQQMEIFKLSFEENCYEYAGELIQFVVSKYKAMGTASIIVRIDDYLPELIKLFVSKCGFSQISYEKLWKINPNNYNSYDSSMFRDFRNSDSVAVSSIYNEQLLPHFRPLLGKNPKEFNDYLFAGLSYFNEYKYIYRNPKSKNILAYISVKTSDNENYIIDFTHSSWEQINIDELLSFSVSKIVNRRKNANIFVKTKRYTQNGQKYEEDLIANKVECAQNKIVLTNSSVRIIKDESKEKQFTVLSQFYGGISAVNKTHV